MILKSVPLFVTCFTLFNFRISCEILLGTLIFISVPIIIKEKRIGGHYE